MTESRDWNLEIALAAKRLATAVFLAIWVADKFVNPSHGQAVLAGFYGFKASSGQMITALGVAQGVLVVAFAIGLLKFWTYGAVLVMHAITTIVSVGKILPPFATGTNILFWAGIPVLAAMLALFLLRDRDRLLAIGR